MEIKQIIKYFEENKLEDLDRARQTICVGEPSLGCNVEEMVIDNDKRMKAVSWFLYQYGLFEANIINYKKYSKPSNYHKETLEMIEEQLKFNKEQYDIALINIKEV